MPKSIREQSVKREVYIGIDPGQSGGIVVLSSDNCHGVETIPNPETELEMFNNLSRLINMFHESYQVKGLLEQVGAMPGQGVSSMFSFGTSYGMCKMLLTAIGASWSEARPQSWMKEIGFSIKSKEKQKDRKERLRKFAQRLYPNLPDWQQTLGHQRSICDALLIAHCLKMRHVKN